MKKRLLITLTSAVIFAAALLMTGCGEKGLDVAYEDLKDKFDDAQKVQFKYSKKNDTLRIAILSEKDVDADDLFDILDEDLEDAECGTLIFDRIQRAYTSSGSAAGSTDKNKILPDQPPQTESSGSADTHTDYMKKVSKRIGKLKCKSLKCLDISNIVGELPSESWTKVLKKAKALYIVPSAFSEMSNYSSKAQKRFEKVKRLWIPAASSTETFDKLYMFPNLKELNFSAGLTKEARETAKKAGLTFTYSTGGTIASAVPINKLSGLKKLERLLVMPEVKDWTPNDNCYNLYLVTQKNIPDVKTNTPGTKWDLDEAPDDGLVALKDINVFETAAEMAKKAESSKDDSNGNDKNNNSNAGSTVSSEPGSTVYATLETLLDSEVSDCYNAGKKFKEKKGKPKLAGKCLVYMAYPNDLSGYKGNKWNKEALYYGRDNVLLTELKKTHVKLPEKAGDYDTFVYVYPRFKEYGKYDKGTVGYTQNTNVRVYNLKKKIKYKSVVIDTVKPANSFRYYGAVPKIHYEDMRMSKITKYLDKLAK